MRLLCRHIAFLAAAAAACGPGHRQADDGASYHGVPIVRAPPVASSAKLTPALRRAMAGADSDARYTVLVDLAVQVDLARLGDALRNRVPGRGARRDSVAVALRLVADSTQAALAPALERLRQQGEVDWSRGVAIVNRLLVRASPRAITALARRAEVARIAEQRSEALPSLTALQASITRGTESAWALAALDVAPAWRAGVDGRGIVVGIIDQGASRSHEQLAAGYRGGDRSWHDPLGHQLAPLDGLTGHGTGILSAAVARNVAGRTIGVAPGAQWIACAGVPAGRYDNVAVTACADWMLATGRPDVLISAWVLPDTGCDRELERIVSAWRVAEILPVFAAGNYGPAPGSDRSPANYGGLAPGGAPALAVGGLSAPGRVLDASGRGPGRCDGSVYPSVVAPGESVTVAFPLGPAVYVRTRGTSVAAGLVAGAAALLLQRYPDASVGDVEAALRAGAVDLGPTGPDNAFGYGRVSVPGALAALGRRLERNAAAASAADAARQR